MKLRGLVNGRVARALLALSLGAVSGLAIVATPLSAAAVDPVWIESDSMQCSVLCREYKLLPVTTGRRSDGGSYFVCALDVGGEGWRVGYQVSTSQDNDCAVGYDGEEVLSRYIDRDDDDDEDEDSDEADVKIAESIRCLCY